MTFGRFQMQNEEIFIRFENYPNNILNIGILKYIPTLVIARRSFEMLRQWAVFED